MSDTRSAFSSLWYDREAAPHPAADPMTLRLRYCWAGELDLMVRLAGLRVPERYED